MPTFAKTICNLITQTGLRYAKKCKCEVNELGVSPLEVAFIAKFILWGVITPQQGQKIYEGLIKRHFGDLV